MQTGNNKRLFVKIKREILPQVKDKYPFIYLERGRLEIDDSSVKWIDSEGEVIPLPIATINALLLGPGTSITHEAVKVAASSNCSICWVGEDSLLFYAAGYTPTSTTRNFRKQMLLAADETKSLKVARNFFARRFPDDDVSKKTLQEMMGMEGIRVQRLYKAKAEEYKVSWKGRKYTPGDFKLSDLTNQILTSSNAALYGIICSAIHSLGYSPHIGFIHSGSPLPFVYDLADLYKEHLCIDLAFYLTFELAGEYNKYRVSEEFRKRVLETRLLENISKDIEELLCL